MPLSASSTSQVASLQRRRLGVTHLVFFTVAASAPLTALAGGVTTAYAVSGNQGVPLAFLVVSVALALFAVGYVAMSRHVASAGAFYAYLARGIGRPAGVAGAFVALVSYNSIQVGLYGLFGSTVSNFAAEAFGLRMPWWIWALLAMGTVAALGLLRVDLNARVLAVLLIAEVAVVAAFDIIGFARPAEGVVTTAPLMPSTLLAGGLGAAIAFTVASFTGFESGAIYSEEARDPYRAVGRATLIAIAFIGSFYALSSWAVVAATGARRLQERASTEGPALIIRPLADAFGPIVADLATALLLGSVFAALLSFHNSVARYLLVLGRERVLSEKLSSIGVRSGAPVAGSIAQSTLALVVVAGFAIADADPMLTLFSWSSGLAALGVVLLLAGTSVAVIGFFRHSSVVSPTLVWSRTIAPALAATLLLAFLVVMVVNFDSLLGVAPSSPIRWLLAVTVLAAALGGAVWALYLRGFRPDVYADIGGAVRAPKFDKPSIYWHHTNEAASAPRPESAPVPQEESTAILPRLDSDS